MCQLIQFHFLLHTDKILSFVEGEDFSNLRVVQLVGKNFPPHTIHRLLGGWRQFFTHPWLLIFQPFNETVKICHNPLVRTCGSDIEGPEVCKTHWETHCETTYKTYEVEQDEPNCVMEIQTRCNNVTREQSFRSWFSVLYGWYGFQMMAFWCLWNDDEPFGKLVIYFSFQWIYLKMLLNHEGGQDKMWVRHQTQSR